LLFDSLALSAARVTAGALLALAVLLAGARPARAQEAAGRVEYVAGGTVFIGVADATRWLPGDTVRVALLRAGDWLGRVRVLGVASTRLSAEWLAGAVMVSAGDSVRVELLRARLDTMGAVPPAAAVPQRAAGREAELPRSGAESPPRRAGGGAQLSGRLGLELDAWRSGSGTGGGALDNTSLLPSLRLRTVLSQLPGELRIRANLRGTYRTDDAGALGPAARLFANELSIERSGRLLQLHGGRFANPYEPYSGYWDGALVRVGHEDGFGGGAVLGFEPRYGNQALDTGRRKAAAFADLHHNGTGMRYDADVSFHRSWDGDSVASTSVGWTLQLGLGGFRFTQLLRADDGAEGWLVGLAQLSASAPLATTARLRLRYTHDDPAAYFGLPSGESWRTRRLGGTLTWFGAAASAGVDVSGAWTMRRSESTTAARTISGWLDLRALPLAGLALELNGSAWSSRGQRTLSAGPALRRVTARGLVRLGYELYHQQLTRETSDIHSVSASFAQRLGRGDLDLRLQYDTGGGLSNTRLLTGFWVPL
jgi:hypothetical protein